MILLILILAPLILTIIGIVKLKDNNPSKKTEGRIFLLIGLVLLGVELLIGFSIYAVYSSCSRH